MICNKCANIFDDSLPLCPECGCAVQQDGQDFIVSISEESFELTLDNTDEGSADIADVDAADAVDETVTDTPCDEEKADDEPETDAEKKADSDDEVKSDESDEKEIVSAESKSPEKAQEKKSTPAKKAKGTKKAPKVRESKQEKNAYNFIISLVSVMGAVLIALCVVGFSTDVFKKDDGVKAVALLGLTSEEQKSLETHLSAVGELSETEFDSSETSAQQFLLNIHPGEEKGIFKKLGKSAKYVTDEADPAQRFFVESDDFYSQTQYSYYKVEKWQIDSILEGFGMSPNYTLNADRCYYYGGYYYFSCENCEHTQKDFSFEITQSKRIQDGSYYAVCSVLSSDSTVRKVYVIAEKVIGENEECSWKITTVQKDPIFDSLGIMIDDSENGEFSYEMKSVSFESLTEDGKTFCRYNLEYPVFKGESSGEKAANNLYESMVATYKAQAENAEKDYKKFKKDGYDESCLPLQMYLTVEVSYNKGNYIGVVNDISKTAPVKKNTQETETEPVIKASVLAEKTLEGYTFDVLTGEYVNKDTIVGKEYLKIAELLYRIHEGYDYSGVMSGENIYDEVPEDTDEIGKHFYDGASTLCSDGYMFIAVNDEGYAEKVVIPFSAQGVFSQTY